MLDLATAHGYKAIDREMILERAGANREDFDAYFTSMEDCALQLFDDFFPPVRERVRRAYESGPGWPASLRAAAYAAGDWIVEHPREIRFAALEMLEVGEMARVRREAAFKQFVHMVDAGRDRASDPASVPHLMGEKTIGAGAEILTKQLRKPGFHDPDAVARVTYRSIPQLMYLAVLPYLGPEAAAKELGIPPPRRREEED